MAMTGMHGKIAPYSRSGSAPEILAGLFVSLEMDARLSDSVTVILPALGSCFSVGDADEGDEAIAVRLMQRRAKRQYKRNTGLWTMEVSTDSKQRMQGGARRKDMVLDPRNSVDNVLHAGKSTPLAANQQTTF